MAGVVGAAGVGDADHRPIERGIGVAGALDEGLAQEQREAGIAVTGQTLAHAGGAAWNALTGFMGRGSRIGRDSRLQTIDGCIFHGDNWCSSRP